MQNANTIRKSIPVIITKGAYLGCKGTQGSEHAQLPGWYWVKIEGIRQHTLLRADQLKAV